MKLEDFLTEAERSGIFGRLGDKVGATFGSNSAKGKIKVEELYKKYFAKVEQWRGKSLLNYASTSDIAKDDNILTLEKWITRWANDEFDQAKSTMIYTLKQLKLWVDLGKKSKILKMGLTKKQVINIVYTYASNTLSKLAPTVKKNNTPPPVKAPQATNNKPWANIKLP